MLFVVSTCCVNPIYIAYTQYDTQTCFHRSRPLLLLVFCLEAAAAATNDILLTLEYI
jgi:hypothetical protein